MSEAAGTRSQARRPRREPLPREHIAYMVESACQAATVDSSLAWRFIAIEDRRLLAVMKAAVDMRVEQMKRLPEFIGLDREIQRVRRRATAFVEGPLCIAVVVRSRLRPFDRALDNVCAVRGQVRAASRRCLAQQSVGAAVQLLVGAAGELGYGASWMCVPEFAVELLEDLLGTRSGEELTSLICVRHGTIARRRPETASIRRKLRYR